MTALGWVFDILLAVALPILAWRVLATRDLYRAVILFIAFGLLVAISWVRLDAPDIALAEAAIGAGLTGALFLNAVGGLAGSSQPEQEKGRMGHETEETAGSEPSGGETPGDPAPEEPVDRVPRPAPVRLTVAVPVLVLVVALGWAVISFPQQAINLAVQVGNNMEASGADHPVTAVLLNFRSYDTLLEVGVLLLAVIAVWSLGLSQVRGGREISGKGASVLNGLVRLLTPIMVVVGGYLLWAGTKQPGGAFQAGAVLGSLGVLLVLSGLARPPLERGGLLRAGVTIGFGLFLAIGAAVLLVTGQLLEYPPAMTYYLILAIEFVLTVSIAFTLMALFVFAPPRQPEETEGSAGGSAEEGP